MSDHSEHTGHAVHIVPVRTYFLVFIALMIGTALTTGVAYIDLGRWNTVVALAIATTKMILVVLFFMHVKYSTRLTWAVVLGSLFWFAILMALTMSDYATRIWRTFG